MIVRKVFHGMTSLEWLAEELTTRPQDIDAAWRINDTDYVVNVSLSEDFDNRYQVYATVRIYKCAGNFCVVKVKDYLTANVMCAHDFLVILRESFDGGGHIEMIDMEFKYE